MTNKPKFLDPRDVEEAVSEVAELARSQDVDLALVGGVAMACYGSDRLTIDVDFAADMVPAGLPVLRTLSFGGIASRTRRDHPVDVIVRIDEYAELYAEAIGRSADVGLPVRVVTPSYLAALKMAAGRDKDELDLKTLLRLGVLDLRETRKVVKRHLGEYAARALDSLVEEVEWQKSRER